MQWASAIREDRNSEQALASAAEEVVAALDGDPDLVLLFLSPHHAPAYPRIPSLCRAALGDAVLLGCSGGGVLGGGRELEHRPALAVAGARLPGAFAAPVRIEPGEIDGEALRQELGPELRGLIVLTDPFGCDADALVHILDRVAPGVPKIGGIASGGGRPGSTVSFLGDGVYRDGAVAIAVGGDVEIGAVVAQGCRPIGEPMIITRVEGNTILELDRGRPLDVLRQVHQQLDEHDRELFANSLYLGVQMEEKRSYAPGDFLVRNLLGLEPERGALAVAALPELYQVVQLHLRDAATSAEDLDRQLAGYRSAHPDSPSGGLLFSCLGRGEQLYDEADHDSRRIREALGDVPLAGFFCNGEIGPVGGKTFVHGYTSTAAFFHSSST